MKWKRDYAIIVMMIISPASLRFTQRVHRNQFMLGYVMLVGWQRDKVMNMKTVGEEFMEGEIKKLIDNELKWTPKGMKLSVEIEVLAEGIQVNFSRSKK